MFWLCRSIAFHYKRIHIQYPFGCEDFINLKLPIFFFCSLVFESPMRASKIVQIQVQSRMKENQPKRRSCHSQLIDRMRTLNSFITFLLQQNWKLKIINSPIARNPKAKNGIVHSIQPNKLNALLRLMDALISLHYISLQWGFFCADHFFFV